jgi:hypothetical protein
MQINRILLSVLNQRPRGQIRRHTTFDDGIVGFHSHEVEAVQRGA